VLWTGVIEKYVQIDTRCCKDIRCRVRHSAFIFTVSARVWYPGLGTEVDRGPLPELVDGKRNKSSIWMAVNRGAYSTW
jgi:hypothetical protein